MKKVTIELPDNYADVLAVTAIGREGAKIINVMTNAFDLDKGIYMEYNGGKWIQHRGGWRRNQGISAIEREGADDGKG